VKSIVLERKQEEQRKEMERKSNIAYNEGLMKSLGFWNVWLYTLLCKVVEK